jgi:hypothetical protein
VSVSWARSCVYESGVCVKRIVEERRSEKRKSQKKEDADARKDRKVAKHCVFPTWARLAARSFSLQIGQLSAALGHVGDYLPDAVGSPQLVCRGRWAPCYENKHASLISWGYDGLNYCDA